MQRAQAHADIIPATSSHPSHPNARRRKVRRGTHSCWDCKRRKVKCTFAGPSDAACIGCRRRGTLCLSQQDVDERAAFAWTPGSGDRRMSDRMVRVEALVEQLASQIAGSDDRETPASAADDDPESRLTASVSLRETQSIDHLPPLDTPLRHGAYESVSAALYAALPPREDIDLIIRAGLDMSPHRLMTCSMAVLEQCADSFTAGLADVPPAGTHPTPLAKYMLILATCLQSAHPEIHAGEIRCLTESPRQLMRRLFEAATDLVTSKDEFLGSVEGLECVMLECMYLANSGNLRRAWFVCRRAMVVAQMLGLHRGNIRTSPHPSASAQAIDPAFFWFRIVCTDRQLCLMLGLPQGTTDVSMASPAALANDSPSGRFERKQCVIASHILSRNESSQSNYSDDLATVLKLDADLQQAANGMPSKWWLVPNLSNALHDETVSFWEMLRLIEQMLYFNLLNLLHLPYMLRSRKVRTREIGEGNDYEYSKLASINASRELLTRYIMLRSHNRVASTCRAVDFFAMTAAMTLVMLHLGGHSKQRTMSFSTGAGGMHMLAYQRNSDRAMMEQVLENMEAMAKLSSDFLSNRSASLLRMLLVLETEAAEGKSNTSEGGHFFRLGIPYFGDIKISSDGDVVSMNSSRDFSADLGDAFREDGAATPNESPPDDVALVPQQTQHISLHSPTRLQQQGQTPNQLPILPYSTVIDDALKHQYPYPGLTAHAEEWMFQPADTTFFDHLMRESGIQSMSDDGSIWMNSV